MDELTTPNYPKEIEAKKNMTKEDKDNTMKEIVMDIIDEYMDLKNEHYVIKVTDKRQSKAFGIMMDAGEGFSGFKKEQYSINGLTKRRLDKLKIKYKIISEAK